MTGTAQKTGAFLTDVKELRRRARVHMERGAVTAGYQADREDLVAERIGIDSYGEMLRYFGNDDPTSRRLIEEIPAKEEEHAEDLEALMKSIPGRE